MPIDSRTVNNRSKVNLGTVNNRSGMEGTQKQQ